MCGRALEFWHFGSPTLTGIEALAQHCETLGYDGLTLTDSQNLSADIYVSMALAARATSKLLIGPGVTNPLTRHAAVTASAIASIQQISEGRAMLGIGRGDSSLFNIGHNSPLKMSASVSVLRQDDDRQTNHHIAGQRRHQQQNGTTWG
jgi:5,10-methylenetetrahydromethanopterin reductase